MTEKEVKKLLKKANEERLFGETAEALAILHRLNNEFPDNITYVGLLASTYYGEKEYDLALECCDKADTIEMDNPNTLDLKGLIAYDKGDKELAEKYYRKALEKEPLLVDCRVKLIGVLFEQGKYEEVTEQCQFVLDNNDPDKKNYTVKELTLIFVTYLSTVYRYYWMALINLKEYRRAISVINEYIDLRSTTTVGDPYFYDRQDTLLLKLYYIIGDENNTERYTDRWKNHYKMSDKFIASVKKEAGQGNILGYDSNNYEIDEKGNFL